MIAVTFRLAGIGGRVVERDHHVTPDGSNNPVIRYAWDSPAALLEATAG